MLNRPLPIPDVESERFWEGCRQGKLMIQKCGDRFQFPPTSVCTGDIGCAPEWQEATGRGRVYSWIVVHVPIPRELFADQVPYITAFITLEEGPRVCANLIDIAPEDVHADMAVEVCFQAVGDGTFTLPFFRPARS
jgi:uncharacterized OB-fold protein